MQLAERLKLHPFGVEARFDYSLVLTYAAPAEYLQKLLPPCFCVDQYGDDGFIAVAMVQTRNLRPKGFPAWMGHDFFLIGYRIFCRFKTVDGKSLRGLYILRSGTNKPIMTLLGSLMTHYNYSTIDVELKQDNSLIEVKSQKDGLDVALRWGSSAAIELPNGSPFSSWQQARRFAGPLPFTFSYLPTQKQVLIVEGRRQFWQPQPMEVLLQRSSFVEGLEVPGVRLASAFGVTDIPYSWQKGRLESWIIH